MSSVEPAGQADVVTYVEPLLNLERAGVITLTGLRVPNTITLEDMTTLGRGVGTMHKVAQWAAGDFLVASETLFPEEWSQLTETLALSERAREDYQRVAKSVPYDQRRPELSYSHHRVVASMKDERKRGELLDQAVAEGWTSRDLEEHRKGDPIGELPPPSLDFRLRQLREAAAEVRAAAVSVSGGGEYTVPAEHIEHLAEVLDREEAL